MTTVIDPLVIDPMNVDIRTNPGTTQDLPDLLDSASTDYGTKDGITLCGPRVYEISDSNVPSTAL